MTVSAEQLEHGVASAMYQGKAGSDRTAAGTGVYSRKSAGIAVRSRIPRISICNGISD
jgi:hypothetical protein